MLDARLLWVLSDNKVFMYHPQFFITALKCTEIAGANSLFFKIAGAKAPIAPKLNTPLWKQPIEIDLIAKVCPLLVHSCTILSSFKIVTIFNITSAEIKTKSDDELLKMITT